MAAIVGFRVSTFFPGRQPLVSDYVVSDLNVNNKDASMPSSSKSGYDEKEVINEDDTTDDEVFESFGGSFGGGNQLEDEDFDD